MTRNGDVSLPYPVPGGTVSSLPHWGEINDSAFADTVDLVAPNPSDLVVIIQSYFDESYDDRLLCVAGYSFTSKSARRFDREWAKMLTRHGNLPYFRMSACNANREPFDRLSEKACISVATKAISLIHRYAAFGFAVTVDQEAFYEVVTDKGFVSTPYELCSWMNLVAVKAAMDNSFPESGMSFIFESGFRHQPQANLMMTNLFNAPEMRAAYRYVSHSFMDKNLCRPSQAADLLAWQWSKDFKRKAKGHTKPRGDLTALLNGTPHYMLHMNYDKMRECVHKLNTMYGTPIGNEVLGIAIRNPSSPLFPKRPGEHGSKEAYEELMKLYPERFPGSGTA